jgi:hypothetical protein
LRSHFASPLLSGWSRLDQPLTLLREQCNSKLQFCQFINGQDAADFVKPASDILNLPGVGDRAILNLNGDHKQFSFRQIQLIYRCNFWRLDNPVQRVN